MAKSEMWDIYDINRQITGTKHTRGIPLTSDEYHLVIHACIFNSKNEMLIQQRQPFKHGWPNMWDISVGGSAIAGETSAQAAEREIYEELGIKVDLSNVRPLYTINFKDGFDDYYIIRKDIAISELKYQQEEVARAKWATCEEIIKMQNNGTMIPYHFMKELFKMNGEYYSRPYAEDKPIVHMAHMENLESWMNLIEIVKDKFPGMSTEEELAEYKKTVVQFINNNSAICATYGNMVVGVLLFSAEYGILCFMAVHPEFRRQGIASEMVELMLEHMDSNKDVIVETYRKDDPDGEAARAFYISKGFKEDKLTVFEGKYPEQQFVLKREV